MIVYISIGNSDDKLTQRHWSSFVANVNEAVRTHGHVHGEWASCSVGRFQNAAWCVDLGGIADVDALQRILREFAGIYGQESIAWAVAPTTVFLKPLGR